MQQPQTQHQNSGAGSTTGELRSDARQIGSKAADRLHTEVDARKGVAATQAKSVSNAIQSAASQLDEDSPAWLRSAFQQGADQIQQFASALEQKDSRQILKEVQGFARQRPGLFLAACAAAGFAASRVLKAGGEQQASQRFGNAEWDRSQPWGEGEVDSAGLGDGGSSSSSNSQNKPFMAAGNSAGQGASQETGTASDEPLILGAGSGAAASSKLGDGR